MISMKQFKNELLPIQFLGLQHLYLGGNSPLSKASLHQNRHASTPCDLFAKTRFSICKSIQSIRFCSTVMLKRGLFSAIRYYGIISKQINIDMILSYSIGLTPIGVAIYEQESTYSGRYAPGRDGREDADIPDRGEWERHTYDGESLVRLLSDDERGDLYGDGDSHLRSRLEGETDNPGSAQGMTDRSMSASTKPFTSAECGRRFTLTAPCYPIIQILDGAFRPAELFPNVSSAGKHLSPVREHTSEKWEGGASAPPETYPEAI